MRRRLVLSLRLVTVRCLVGVVLPPVRAVREEEDLDSAASILSLHEEQEDPLAITREDWSAGGRFSRSEPRPLSSSNYPETEPLLDIISRWNPDNVTVPTPFKEKLAVFNFSNATERALAETYRDAELPFKVFDVPNVEEVRQKWTDPYLIEMMEAGTVQYKVEQSSNNHFMYWQHKAGVLSLYSDWKPPTNIVSHVTFSNWLNMARAADAEAKGPEEEHYYLMLGTAPLSAIRKRVGRIVKPYQHFVTSDLPIFVPDTENFFVTDAEANKGIQCRFGMRGVIAEAHYDGGRNMVAMLKGAKRYILAPPTACQRLSIIPDRRHPSFRHSTADWSDAREAGDRLSHHESVFVVVLVLLSKKHPNSSFCLSAGPQRSIPSSEKEKSSTFHLSGYTTSSRSNTRSSATRDQVRRNAVCLSLAT